MQNTQRWTLLLGALLLLMPMLPLQAQDANEEPDTVEMPTTRARSDATASVGQNGMIFELNRGARAVIPAGLPIGNSRRITFAYSRQRPRPQEVASGFRRFGPVMSLNAAINASENPILISVRAPRSPAGRGKRAVLAMEQPTICDDQHRRELPGGAAGLCSSWTLLDATHSDGRISSRVPAPGGFRLVFGSVPAND